MTRKCRTDNVEERFWPKVNKDTESGCWEWMASCKNNYGRIGIGYRQDYTHRVSWELHNGPIPDGLQVLHKCDNRKCVNPDHLFLGTQRDNVDDMINKGRGKTPPIYRPLGNKNGMVKLTLKQVTGIIAKCKNGILHRVIAKEYGISRQTVSDISTGRRWPHAKR